MTILVDIRTETIELSDWAIMGSTYSIYVRHEVRNYSSPATLVSITGTLNYTLVHFQGKLKYCNDVYNSIYNNPSSILNSQNINDPECIKQIQEQIDLVLRKAGKLLVFS